MRFFELHWDFRADQTRRTGSRRYTTREKAERMEQCLRDAADLLGLEKTGRESFDIDSRMGISTTHSLLKTWISEEEVEE